MKQIELRRGLSAKLDGPCEMVSSGHLLNCFVC
jgi:hypothetical protein